MVCTLIHTFIHSYNYAYIHTSISRRQALFAGAGAFFGLLDPRNGMYAHTNILTYIHTYIHRITLTYILLFHAGRH